uniref:Putative tick metalloprotease n=1 Tax=Amblyomma americanum TaxID=6943 RepID=A0A0C9SEH8_AMBAM
MIPLVVILFVQMISAPGVHAAKLVYPRLLQERAGEGRLLLRIHDTLILNLEKASVAAPNLYVHSEESGRPIVDLLDGQEFNDNLYEDADNLATITLLRSGDSLQVKGLVGPQQRIEPLMNAERSGGGLVAHIIHEISQSTGVDKAIPIPETGVNALLQARNAGPTPNIPSNVTVEIFVITDKPHHGHFKHTSELIAYICVMLNSVNLRFKKLTMPRVRLLLVGVEKTSAETFRRGPYGYVHDTQTILQLRYYAGNNTAKFKHTDILFYITGYDVVIDDKKTGNISSAGLGIAYVSGLCSQFFVGLGEDSAGYYTGVGTMAHEIGHL